MAVRVNEHGHYSTPFLSRFAIGTSVSALGVREMNGNNNEGEEMRKRFGTIFALAFGLALHANAQLAQPHFVKVSVQNPKTAAVHKVFQVKVQVIIAPPYHIQAHSPAPNFIPTVLTVKTPPYLHVEKILYPPAKSIRFAGQQIPVYEGTITVEALLKADRPGTFLLPIVLRYQGCNESTCYPPTELQTKTKIVVGATKVSLKASSGLERGLK
ncbi:protein-disulfide reductase DsbD domain-containing protein [Chthonomonas calidirosea]|uniref:protein-disulfide reductase DsbD domain-containing protein n=1 Tax=Chthonomonas calidirosea TaxID=454171 RepID=UPI000AF6EFC0|nr:protein-disulfide reductase DsbD domain-containing protein [Chthonomonas calidirosea]